MKKKWKNHLSGRKEKKFIPGWWLRLCTVFLLAVGVFACKDDGNGPGAGYNPGQPVTVMDIMPATGGILTPVVIKGNNFGTDKTKVQVFFNERSAAVVNVMNEFIYVLVPKCEGGENSVKVVVDEKNEGVLQDVKFDYVVSAKVTTVASDYIKNLSDMESIDIDDEENLVINCQEKLQLYSIRDNKMAEILGNMGFIIADGCFSRDFQKYYALSWEPRKALIVILNKKNNWEREVVFDSDKIADEISYSYGIAADDRGYIFIYGTSRESGGVIMRIDPESREIKKLGKISIETGRYLAFNPVDKYIYLSVPKAKQIIRFDSRAETIGESDWEVVVGTPGRDHVDGSLGEAGFDDPEGISFDEDNNMYVADDAPSHTVRKVNLNTGEVTTIAGKDEGQGYVDGDASGSKFYHPLDVASTRDGIVYVMEYFASQWDFIESVQRLRCVAIQ